MSISHLTTNVTPVKRIDLPDLPNLRRLRNTLVDDTGRSVDLEGAIRVFATARDFFAAINDEAFHTNMTDDTGRVTSKPNHRAFLEGRDVALLTGDEFAEAAITAQAIVSFIKEPTKEAQLWALGCAFMAEECRSAEIRAGFLSRMITLTSA